MFENRLQLVENLLQIMHFTLIFHVQVLVGLTYISRAYWLVLTFSTFFMSGFFKYFLG